MQVQLAVHMPRPYSQVIEVLQHEHEVLPPSLPFANQVLKRRVMVQCRVSSLIIYEMTSMP